MKHWSVVMSRSIHESRKTFAPSFTTDCLRIYLTFLTCVIPSLQAVAGKAFLPPAPAAAGKSYFFASRGACASSGQFSAQDCAAAFARVDTLLHERAPKFTNKYECVLEFKLCEKDADSYLPGALGVELIRSSKGLVALPMLAVETPRDMLRDPETPPPSGRDVVADVASGSRRSGNEIISPFGALAFPAPVAAVAPPSLKGFHRLVEEAELRLAIFQKNAKTNPNWRAER
jgi:hypothetical protein